MKHYPPATEVDAQAASELMQIYIEDAYARQDIIAAYTTRENGRFISVFSSNEAEPGIEVQEMIYSDLLAISRGDDQDL